jgi:hypothetical protein
MAAGSTEHTSGYFGDQTPSESKKEKSLVSRPAFGFIISGAPHFRNPFLTNQLGSTLRRPRHLFDISRTFEITVSVFPPLF